MNEWQNALRLIYRPFYALHLKQEVHNSSFSGGCHLPETYLSSLWPHAPRRLVRARMYLAIYLSISCADLLPRQVNRENYAFL